MARILAAACVLAFPLTAAAQGDAESDQDDVCIVEPVDGAAFDGAPAAIAVEVETVNNSGLVVEEVVLRMDGVEVEDMSCAGPGSCTFDVEVDEGEHRLQAFAIRNLGPELPSNQVEIAVAASGGSTGGGSTTGAGGSSSSSFTGAATGGSTGDDPSAGDDPGDNGGCGCTAARDEPAGLGLLVLLVLQLRRSRGAGSDAIGRSSAGDPVCCGP